MNHFNFKKLKSKKNSFSIPVSLLKLTLKLKLILTLILISIFNISCQITYLTKSAYQQLWILSHREPIEKVLQSNDISSEEKHKLELTLKVRDFATQKLKLNVGKSYSTYVQLKKPYVVWAVNASEKWQLQHFIWDYPIVGKLPYKGFPNESDAKSEAQSFDPEKYDTYVRGVSAYSTLGWFADPLLSTMIKYSDYNLVDTIIHESTHATLFIEGNADFNERLASFVGNKGAELYYLDTEGPHSPTLLQIQKENEDDGIFSQFISEELKSLKKFYDSKPEKIEALRVEQFQKIKSHFNDQVKPKLKTNNYNNFEKVTLNNARLLLYKTYVEDIGDFEKLFTYCHQDIPTFIEQAKTLEKSKDPITDLRNKVLNFSSK